MKKIVKRFEKIVDDIRGKLVWIGLNEEYLIKRISNNSNITYCDLLNSFTSSKEKGKGKKEQHLSIKDFRNYYKKKNIDYLIADIKDINKFLPRFIPDSIYICSKEIYIYGDNSYDFERILKRYKRYTKEISLENYNNQFVIKITVIKTKNKFFKDKIYFIFDNIVNLIDLISDLIVS